MNRRYTIVGAGPDHIELQTSECTDIENYQGSRISEPELRELEDLEDEYQHATFRTGPHPEYNCHGLTFASRRTEIDNQSDLRRIIKDDSYRQVDENDIQPGDIILYHGDEGDIEHSGIVVSTPDERLQQPSVVSKWGNAGEALHPVPNCPYDPSNTKYYRRIWVRNDG